MGVLSKLASQHPAFDQNLRTGDLYKTVKFGAYKFGH